MQELYAVTYNKNGQDFISEDIPNDGFIYLSGGTLATTNKSEVENSCAELTIWFPDITYKVVKLKIEECE